MPSSSSRLGRLLPLVLASAATQAQIVVLAPLVVAIGQDLDASLSQIGLARSVLAGAAVAASLGIGPLIDRIGVRPLIVAGGVLAMAGCAVSAAAPSLEAFYAAQVVVGTGVACLLSASFAGVAAHFAEEQATWAVGWVVGAQSFAWILGNPLVGLLADHGSWRLAYLVPGSLAALALVAGVLAPARDPRPAGAPAEGGVAGGGLLAVLRDPSARRWTLAELVAYSAWTTQLTYVGALYIESYGVSESTVGVLLAGGSVVFLVTSTNVARLTERFPRRALIVAAALLMGAMLMLVLNVRPAVWFTLAGVCVMAFFAAVRSAATSALGLAQLPGRAGSMMAARTASAQLGYMIGAAAGGAVLALGDFGTLGFVLFGGLAVSALLVYRVSDPLAPPSLRAPEPVPD